MPESARVWLITGASSGFGRALTEAALARGDAVAALARRVDALTELSADRLLPLSADVTSQADRERAVAATLQRFARIDVLANIAGRTHVGAVEETSDAELRELMGLHLFAPAALIRAVLPAMRQQRRGAIVQMSSIGGQIARPGFGAYNATKFALEGLSEALADEVAPFGIKVLVVEPGAFRTGLFAAGTAGDSAVMSEYADIVGGTRNQVHTGDGAQPGDPAKAAQTILRVLDADHPPLRLPLGGPAIDRIAARLRDRQTELQTWAALGRDTDLEPG